MKLLTLLLTLSSAVTTFAADNAPTNRPPAQVRKTYELGPDSLPQEGVPKGKLDGPFLFRSQAFSNTMRQTWVYVPGHYTPEKPACVLVFQDGQRATRTNGSLHAPQVMAALDLDGLPEVKH
jgi:enterochelin esterase-like enzyme